MVKLIVLLPLSFLLCGCFTLTGVDTSVSAGRTFDDGAVLAQGKTAWGLTVTGHWLRQPK